MNARLLLDTRHDGLTVPASVVQQGQQGPYAYVINPDSSVSIRPIKVAQISDGQALIDSGLVANEQVVIDGQYKLQPGTHRHLAARQGRPAEASSSKANNRRRSREYFSPLHLSADSDRSADGGVVGGRHRGLSRSCRSPRCRMSTILTLTVTAQLPGADPQTMASTVASPLELQFGEIPGLTQMTSASALGYVQVTLLQFELAKGRQIDGAVSDTHYVGDQCRDRVSAQEHAVSAPDQKGQSGGHANPGAWHHIRHPAVDRCRRLSAKYLTAKNLSDIWSWPRRYRW